jgi:hypothetical protein
MQNLVVGLIVFCAAIYALMKFTPVALRAQAAPYLVRAALFLHLPAQFARRLEQKVTTAGGCGSCNSCNACATDPVEEPVASLRGIPVRVVNAPKNGSVGR